MPRRGERTGVAERFAGKFTKDKVTGCWNWTSASSGRYGVLWIGDGRSKYAHRVSYELHCGPIPDGLIVCHKCDNGHCVNPDHLFLGTHKDNSDDKWAKGRGPDQSGERNPQAKLKQSDIPIIRELATDRLTQAAIAQRFGVCRETIGHVLRGRSWATI